MSLLRTRSLFLTALAACGVIVLAAMTSAGAAVISSTPTLPVLGVPYTSSGGAGCFLAAGVCVAPGALTLTSVVSSTFDSSGQEIVADVSFTNILTSLGGGSIGPLTLTGTMEQKVLGRTFATEVGTWDTELVTLSLSGLVLGHTLTLTLDEITPSVGETSIISLGGTGNELFRIDSFFDVFVELSLDTPTPLHAKRGPIHASLGVEVPEPATLALLGLGCVGLAWSRRRSVCSS